MTKAEKIQTIALVATAIVEANDDFSFEEAVDLAIERIEVVAERLRRDPVSA